VTGLPTAQVLQHVLLLARDFAVGKEVAARSYVQYHPERIAVVVGLHATISLAMSGRCGRL
jgi:hypothetical protein